MFWHSSTSLQVKSVWRALEGLPICSKPVLQVHSKDPTVLAQDAWTPASIPQVVEKEHSFMSTHSLKRIENFLALAYNFDPMCTVWIWDCMNIEMIVFCKHFHPFSLFWQIDLVGQQSQIIYYVPFQTQTCLALLTEF